MCIFKSRTFFKFNPHILHLWSLIFTTRTFFLTWPSIIESMSFSSQDFEAWMSLTILYLSDKDSVFWLQVAPCTVLYCTVLCTDMWWGQMVVTVREVESGDERGGAYCLSLMIGWPWTEAECKIPRILEILSQLNRHCFNNLNHLRHNKYSDIRKCDGVGFAKITISPWPLGGGWWPGFPCDWHFTSTALQLYINSKAQSFHLEYILLFIGYTNYNKLYQWWLELLTLSVLDIKLCLHEYHVAT